MVSHWRLSGGNRKKADQPIFYICFEKAHVVVLDKTAMFLALNNMAMIV